MGPVNLAMWKAFGGIFFKRNLKSRYFIPHPIDNNYKLFFIADAPHLLKNLRTSLLNNKIMELPITFLKTYNLSYPVVKCEHISELIDIVVRQFLY